MNNLKAAFKYKVKLPKFIVAVHALRKTQSLVSMFHVVVLHKTARAEPLNGVLLNSTAETFLLARVNMLSKVARCEEEPPRKKKTIGYSCQWKIW